MKKSTLIASIAAISLTASGVVFAIQDNGRDAGELSASSTIVVDKAEGDEVSVSYNTLKWGAATIKAMSESAEMREGWSQFLPQLLQAELNTDVDLTWKQYKLPAGSYGLSAQMTDDGGWNLILLQGDRPRGRIPLTVAECGLTFDYLNMSLLSAGNNGFKLMVGYGGYAGTIDFAVAAEAEDEEDADG